ncbi:MAG: transcriptional repressor [Tannerellaceae bacterium]|nr:transcriptional repressor [Tannerellaceae bacterium]
MKMNAADILKSKGLKKTAQQILLINILQNSDISLTENDIKAAMGEMYDRVTFYRTVQTLQEAQIIHRIAVDNITVKYVLNDFHTAPHASNHAHFFCINCQQVVCLGYVSAPTYTLPEGYRAESCETLIKGICKDCSK